MTFAKLPSEPRLDALTGSRFLAAFAILVLHGQVIGYSVPPWLDLAQAVSYFFVLSGFILGFRYPHFADRYGIARFYWARFARIWPVHAACLGLILISFPVGLWNSSGALPWVVLALQTLLLNAWVPTERFVFGFNPPAWSISVEWFFYALYPLLVLHWSRTWWWKLVGSCLLLAVLAAIVYGSAMPAVAPPGEDNRVSALALLYGNPLARLFEFTLGMTIALVWQRHHRRLRLSLPTATVLELALLCAIAADLYWSGHSATGWGASIGRPGFDWRVLTATPLGTGACLLYAPLILLLAAGHGLLARTLATPYVVILGESSYSLYMLHVFVMMQVSRNPSWLAEWSVGARTAFWFAAITLAAWAVWRFLERPARLLLLRHQPSAWRPLPGEGRLSRRSP